MAAGYLLTGDTYPDLPEYDFDEPGGTLVRHGSLHYGLKRIRKLNGYSVVVKHSKTNTVLIMPGQI